MATNDVWNFILNSTNYTMAFDYDTNGNQIYIGWANPGSSQSDPTAWRIMQQVFNGSNQTLQILWPNGSTAFNFQWTNRASYTYS